MQDDCSADDVIRCYHHPSGDVIVAASSGDVIIAASSGDVIIAAS